MQIPFARVNIITSTARASSVFQSNFKPITARILLGLFYNDFKCEHSKKTITILVKFVRSLTWEF